ncbi:hypothetical protein [Streptococcus suis]|uniref:Membrane protein n=1 Tax=Streptococcus suis TaxID=1307 RepID=A0A0Z8JBV6_STRSU|nr:hypothetical protein [Streptococcus suis]CYV51053.1 membrane protein [Streptococcus suis]
MTRFYTNRSDFEQNHWLDSQKSRVVAMLRDIDSVSSTVQSEGLSHLYRSRGEASLGASKPSSTFSQAVDRVDSMLRSAGKIHKDIVQNIDSKFTKGLDKSFQSLNEVNGSKNPYMSKGKYEKTYTTTNYTSNYGYVTQTHTRQVHYSLSDILDGTNSPIPAAQSLYQDRVKNLREQLRQTDQLTDKQIKELESKSDAELVQEFYPTLESDYSQIKNSTWQEENKEALGWVDTGLKFLAIAALTAGTLMTGGAALPLALAGGAYLFADGAHSAITGNTLITGTQLSTEERIWAGAEAVVTLATLGSFAAGQSALRAGKQIPTTVQTIGKLAKYADEGVEALQWGSGVLQGDAANATLDYIGGKAFEGIVEGSVKGLQNQLSHIEVSSPSQIQLNARQGQDFVDLQTVEFGKIASKVENNITIKMTVDGVEQKIRVDAIGFDEAGNIRIQEYTTAQNGLKISRQNLLEDLSKYGGTIVGAGKGEFVGGVEIPKGTRIDVVSQKTGNVTIGPVQVSDIYLPTDSRYDQQLIVDYTETMGTTYTQTDINKLTELTTHNADSDIALLGYFEFESVTSYEQIAHANGYTYFDVGNRGWEAITKVDLDLPYKVNDEFLLKQIREGKDFILTSNPYSAKQIADTTGKGKSYVQELKLLIENGYKIEVYGNFWRATK